MCETVTSTAQGVEMMGHATQPPAITARHAAVRLRDGNTYVGKAIYEGRCVSIDGSLRVIEMDGVVSYRRRRKRTINLALVREILWDDE